MFVHGRITYQLGIGGPTSGASSGSHLGKWTTSPNPNPNLVTNDNMAQAMLWAKRLHVLAEHVEYVSREMKLRRLLNE